MSAEKCSHCQKTLAVNRQGESLKYYSLTLNKKLIHCCENCWENNKENYKQQLKTEWDRLEEWEKASKDKSDYVHVAVWTAFSSSTTAYVDLGKLCEECDNWCDKDDSGRGFCSPQHEFIIKEKQELKGLQTQWETLRNLPENYPDRDRIKRRKEELEKKYSNDPRERERDKPKPTVNLGPDYSTLKAPQQEGRQKTQASWVKHKKTSFIHFECDKLFAFDQTIQSYYEAREKAKQELNTHKSTCQKNNTQSNWEKEIKAKGNIIYTCQKCWGKIRWDKTITDYTTAKQQALSDLKYHQQHECHLIPTQRTIAIYHSPNQGGNQHAPIDNSLTDDDTFLQREKEEVSSNPFNWTPWVIGAIVIIVGGLIAYYLVKKNKNEK